MANVVECDQCGRKVVFIEPFPPRKLKQAHNEKGFLAGVIVVDPIIICKECIDYLAALEEMTKTG